MPSPLGGWGRSGSQKAHRPEGSTPPATTGVTAAIDQLQASPPPPLLTLPPPLPPHPTLPDSGRREGSVAAHVTDLRRRFSGTGVRRMTGLRGCVAHTPSCRSVSAPHSWPRSWAGPSPRTMCFKAGLGPVRAQAQCPAGRGWEGAWPVPGRCGVESNMLSPGRRRVKLFTWSSWVGGGPAPVNTFSWMNRRAEGGPAGVTFDPFYNCAERSMTRPLPSTVFRCTARWHRTHSPSRTFHLPAGLRPCSTHCPARLPARPTPVCERVSCVWRVPLSSPPARPPERGQSPLLSRLSHVHGQDGPQGVRTPPSRPWLRGCPCCFRGRPSSGVPGSIFRFLQN